MNRPSPGTSGSVDRATDDVIERIAHIRIVPVITIDDADDAGALVSALVAGGLSVVEITLRTPAGLAALERAAAQVPDAIVGAGSVTSGALAASAVDSGARFLVAPGLDDTTIETARDLGVPLVPGVATATELTRAVNAGIGVVKVFPAEQLGGPALVASFGAVWPDVRFLPTGGITATTALRYLALRQVIAVGGSWMATRSTVRDRNWAAVTNSATDATRRARSGA